MKQAPVFEGSGFIRLFGGVMYDKLPQAGHGGRRAGFFVNLIVRWQFLAVPSRVLYGRLLSQFNL
jgi:hypothetical protein